MGIRGLQNWIRWTASTSVRAPEWTKLVNTRIGIDILGFLYRAKARGIYPIVYVAHLIAMCKRMDIEPIIIFDGKPPTEKQRMLEQRTALRAESNRKKSAILQTSSVDDPGVEKELRKLELNTTYFTSEEREQVKQFLYSCGVLGLNASGEADNTLAYFSRNGWISAVLSSDFDLLPRGVETLIVPVSEDLPSENSGWKQYTLSTILQTSDLSYNQFVEMCVLMGSDYTSNMPAIPHKTAYWTVKHSGSIEYTLARFNVRDTTSYGRAKQILLGATDNETSLMNEKQWEKWRAGPPPVEIETLLEFSKLYFPSQSTRLTAIESSSNSPHNVLVPGNSLLQDLSENTRSTCYDTTPCAA